VRPSGGYKDAYRLVIEVQHSNITDAERLSREAFGFRMEPQTAYWVVAIQSSARPSHGLRMFAPHSVAPSMTEAHARTE
jgi:hypothetical protein